MLSISKAAKQIGLDNITGLISLEELMRAPLPCILHWSQNHFVVLYKVKKCNTFYLSDPAKGKVKLSLNEFCAHWLNQTGKNENKGVAMFLSLSPSLKCIWKLMCQKSIL